MQSIDLNCDMGEGGDFDKDLMPLITSCNIACGGHYGDTNSIRKVVDLALENDLNIGAHPSYPDKTNFGRKPMKMRLTDLKATLKEQINRIYDMVNRAGGELHHIKPHGFLYNQIVYDMKKANLVIKVVEEIDKNLILFVPPNSLVHQLADGRLETWTEGFADRNYNPDYTLVSRQKSNAVLEDKKQVLNRVLNIVKNKKIEAVNGKILQVDFDTICLHSDTVNSIGIAQYLNEKLRLEDIKIT